MTHEGLTQRKRGKRKPKPLYERSGPKFFGHGFNITYNDLRDIAAALNDDQRQISAEVKEVLPSDLRETLELMPTADQQMMICRLFVKMSEQNRRNLVTCLVSSHESN